MRKEKEFVCMFQFLIKYNVYDKRRMKKKNRYKLPVYPLSTCIKEQS